MAPQKPKWDWKARGCAEFANFTVPFAVKEYVQNVVGQVLKDLEVREWSDWQRADLRELPPKERERRKQSLIQAYPGLLTGPDGGVLKRTKAWLPLYILSATIPQSLLRSMFTTTDLRIALVVWRHSSAEIAALSVYNNHLDSKATFSSFTVDGASTSRHNPWAVGEKGKGFILATQYLLEQVEEHADTRKGAADKLPKDTQGAVSFRVGHQIGILKWKKPYPDEDQLLQVVLDDLTPRTVEEYMEKQAADTRHKRRNEEDEEDEDSDDPYGFGYTSTSAETPKLRKTAESALKGIYSRRVTQQLDCKGDTETLSNHGRNLVFRDEVAITVIGLPSAYPPEYLFSAIYGIIPPAQAWRVPRSQIQFFIAAADDTDTPAPGSTKAKFYHRDQLVPYGIHLNKLSINYHGDLKITSDRVAILRNRKVIDYERALAETADNAFRTIPELALQLALDVLSDEHSESLARLVQPTDKDGVDGYRGAFEAALRQMHPEIAADALLHPTAGSLKKTLFQELGLTPVEVSSSAWRIMEKSGAYVTIEDHARGVLLDAPEDPRSRGLERLRLALSVVAPDVPSENITIRQYSKSTPHVVWDKDNNLFAFALPPACDDHPSAQCLCWVGPFLHDAAKDYDGARLSTRKLFRAYLLCMKGEANMEDELSQIDDRDLMDIDKPADDGDKSREHSPGGARNETNNRDSSPAMYRATTPRSRSPKANPLKAKTPPASFAWPVFHHSPQRVRTPLTQSESNVSNDVVRLDSPTRSIAPHPETVPAPLSPRLPAPQAWQPVAPAVEADDDDATVAAMQIILANYKYQKAALADASSVMNDLQEEINVWKARYDSLNTEMEALKIESELNRRGIEDLNRIVEEKDSKISSLKKELQTLEAEMEEDARRVEENARRAEEDARRLEERRKRPRTE
ncbi:hypothetical protein DFH07DRAFT_924622 [Mycena maculata]|uniref:Uncharacterized protein n=1 Tax=Mycena maculata TaxID=230809 RepID=A0AAD7IKU2_9AGAR|nr:hypothetical protein DFH07DRAFT_924622 [Mycena maculata]